MTKLSIR